MTKRALTNQCRSKNSLLRKKKGSSAEETTCHIMSIYTELKAYGCMSHFPPSGILVLRLIGSLIHPANIVVGSSIGSATKVPSGTREPARSKIKKIVFPPLGIQERCKRSRLNMAFVLHLSTDSIAESNVPNSQ